MVNDFDDERTLDEEEALAAGEQQDPRAELSNLQKEGDMPLEELLAMYGLNQPGQRQELRPPPPEAPPSPEQEPPEEDKPDPSALSQLYTEPGITEPPRFLRSVSRPPSEEEDDYDYSPEEEDWKKTIMVGSDYQAWIPEGLCNYDDALPYENDDKLLWNPTAIQEKDTEEYMTQVRSLSPAAEGLAAIPTGPQLRDDEQALFLLQQCGHNVDEALRRRRISRAPAPSPAPPPPLALWSEEECRNFENGLKAHGKDFHLIQQHKVRTRSVGELVQFYYIWKKTERHDMFANKARLEKKKYTLHPGHTDYMDRFLEEQEESPAPPAPPDPLAVGREVFSELPRSPPLPSPAPSHSAEDTDQEAPSAL